MVDVSPYLRSVHIPKDHRAHVFVRCDHFKFMRKLAIAWGIYHEAFSSNGIGDRSLPIEDRWVEVYQQNEYLARSFFSKKVTELNLAGYCILEGIADPLAFPEQSIDGKAPMPDTFPTMPNGVLFDRIHRCFPGEEVLRDETEREDFNFIVNTADEEKDGNDNQVGVGRVTCTNKFLMETLETSENVPLAEKRAHLDVWIGILLSMMNLDNGGRARSYFPRTGGRFLLTGKRCTPQVGHNDFPVREGDGSPGYFVIVTGPEMAHLWVAPSSHIYICLLYTSPSPRDKRQSRMPSSA